MLQNNGGDALSLSTNSGFVFSAAVPDGGSYATTVLTQPAGQTCSVGNGSGTVNGGNVINVSITCTAASTAVLIGTMGLPVFQGGTQMAFDPSGNAIAVWVQGVAGLSNVMFNRYSAATDTWGTASAIPSLRTSGCEQPQVGFDSLGNATAVCLVTNSAQAGVSLMAGRYTASTGTWSPAVPVEEDGGQGIANPKLAMAGASGAAVVWQSTFNLIKHSAYNSGSGAWSVPERVSNNAGLFPQVTTLASGHTTVVWTERDGARFGVWSNSLSLADPANGIPAFWRTPQQLDSVSTTNAIHPQVVMDAHARALVVWEQSDGTRSHILGNRDFGTGTWTTAFPVETDNTGGDATNPRIGIDSNGDALAVWEKRSGSLSNVMASRLTDASGQWGAATLLESVDSGNAVSPQIALNASGNALSAWIQDIDGVTSNGGDQSWANRYSGDCRAGRVDPDAQPVAGDRFERQRHAGMG